MRVELPIFNYYPIANFSQLLDWYLEDEANGEAYNSVVDDLVCSITPKDNYARSVSYDCHRMYMDFFEGAYDAKYVGDGRMGDNITILADVDDSIMEEVTHDWCNSQEYKKACWYYQIDADADVLQEDYLSDDDVIGDILNDRVNYVYTPFQYGLMYLLECGKEVGSSDLASLENYIDEYTSTDTFADELIIKYGNFTEYNRLAEKVLAEYEGDLTHKDEQYPLWLAHELIHLPYGEIAEDCKLITRLRRVVEDFSPQAFNYMKKEYGLDDETLRKEAQARDSIDNAFKSGISIYDRAIELMSPKDIDHYQTDLYLRVNPISIKLIDEYEYKGNVTRFLDNIDRDWWFDIPFAYPLRR